MITSTRCRNSLLVGFTAMLSTVLYAENQSYQWKQISEPPKSCEHVESLLNPCQTSGYFGLLLSGESAISKIDGTQSRIDGIGLSVLLAHKTSLGLALFHLAAPLSKTIDDRKRHLSLQYGGFEFSSIGNWQGIFSTRWSIFAGNGFVSMRDAVNDATLLNKKYAIWVNEFRYGFYMTLTPFVRLGFDLGYRFVPINADGMSGSSLSGATYALVLRGGKL